VRVAPEVVTLVTGRASGPAMVVVLTEDDWADSPLVLMAETVNP